MVGFVDTKNFFDDLYAERILKIDESLNGKTFCKTQALTIFATVVGITDLVQTILLLPFRTAGCILVNPPIKVFRLLSCNRKKLEEFDNETTAFFSLEKVIQNASRIITLVLSILSHLVFFLFPKINVRIQQGLNHVSGGLLINGVPKWVQAEMVEDAEMESKKTPLEELTTESEEPPRDSEQLETLALSVPPEVDVEETKEVAKAATQSKISVEKKDELKTPEAVAVAMTDVRDLITQIKDSDEKSLMDDELLERINKSLLHFQIRNFQQEMEKVRGENDVYESSELDRLEAQDYVKMLKILTRSLKEEKNARAVAKLLKTITRILNVMTIKGESETDKEAYKQALKEISLIANNDVWNNYLFISYYVLYNLQAFSITPNDQPDVECSLSLFNILATLKFEGSSLEEPWQIVSKLFEEEIATAKIKDKLKFWKTKDGRWFLNLFAVRRMLLDPDKNVFSNFVKKIKENSPNIQTEMGLHNPFFVFGFAELLWEIIHFPQLFKKMDSDVKDQAKALLKMIESNNKNDEKNNLLFQIPKEDRNGLIEANNYSTLEI